jgi:HSP20 family molecular chaperone IbpA
VIPPALEKEHPIMANVSGTSKGPSEQAATESTRVAHFTPRVDIYETDKELVLYADLPGVRPEDVDLRCEQGELVLHARVKPRTDGQHFLVNEYGVGDFYRVFTVHETIDNTRIQAEFKNGVLTVHLPKVEPAKPRQIPVRGA